VTPRLIKGIIMPQENIAGTVIMHYKGDGFDTAYDALRSLALTLLKAFLPTTEELEKMKRNHFTYRADCPSCAARYVKDYKTIKEELNHYSLDRFNKFIADLSAVHSVSYNQIRNMANEPWTPFRSITESFNNLGDYIEPNDSGDTVWALISTLKTDDIPDAYVKLHDDLDVAMISKNVNGLMHFVNTDTQAQKEAPFRELTDCEIVMLSQDQLNEYVSKLRKHMRSKL
jgi:hypothetical protein